MIISTIFALSFHFAVMQNPSNDFQPFEDRKILPPKPKAILSERKYLVKREKEKTRKGKPTNKMFTQIIYI